MRASRARRRRKQQGSGETTSRDAKGCVCVCVMAGLRAGGAREARARAQNSPLRGGTDKKGLKRGTQF